MTDEPVAERQLVLLTLPAGSGERRFAAGAAILSLAVSYTHLDVYKRQARCSRASSALAIPGPSWRQF